MPNVLASWKSHAQTVRIETDHPSVPVVYAGLSPIDAGGLAIAAQEELAAGWPQAVVDRCTARRLATYRVSLSPRGVSVGPNVPRSLYLPGTVRGLQKLARVFRRGEMGEPYQTTNQHYGEFAPFVADLKANPTNYIRRAVNDPAAEVTLVTVGSLSTPGDTGIAELMNLLKTACAADVVSTEYVWVAIYVGAFPEGQGWTWGNHVYARVRTKHAVAGVGGVIITPANNVLVNGTSDMWNRPFLTRVIIGAAGLSDVLSSVCPGMTQYWLPYGVGLTEMHVATVSTSPSTLPYVAWDSVSQTDFDRLHGVGRYTACAIGNPEFANRVELIGATSWDDATRTLSIAESTLYIDWFGARLAELASEATQAEKDQLAAIRIISRLGRTATPLQLALGDTRIEQTMQEEGESMADEVLIEATADADAVTYSAAAARARGRSDQVYHRVIPYLTSVDEIARVELTKSGATVLIRCFDAAGSFVTDDVDAARAAVSSGVPVLIGYTPASDAYFEAFGYTQAQLLSRGENLAMGDDWDEAAVFKDENPDIDAEPLHVRAALWILQHAINRQPLTSYLLGSCTMAQIARRRLL